MLVLMKIQSGLQMTQNLNDFLRMAMSKQYATESGTKTHLLLQGVVIDDVNGNRGDTELVSAISNKPELKPFFAPNARTEVPIAGVVHGAFVSRRIDRLLINDNDKTIVFMDYKTDSNPTEFYDKYKKQLSEYAELLCSAYPGYKITGFILWVRDWRLEKVVSV